MIPLVNEFVINKWLTYFSTCSINSGRKNQKMYGISGLCSYIYILLRIAMSLHSVRESNESKWLLLSKSVTFYFLFFFFSPSPLFLYICSLLCILVVECGSFVHIFFLLYWIVDEMSSVAVTM